MATGGYRGSGASTTTDFLEEWKAKREKMRAKQAPAAAGDCKAAGTTAELAGGGGLNCVSLARGVPKEPPPAAAPQGGKAAGAPEEEEEAAAAATEEEKVAAKSKGSSGPSARKGKGQIEKRKLREKRRSTGVVNIPAAEVGGGAARRVEGGRGSGRYT